MVDPNRVARIGPAKRLMRAPHELTVMPDDTGQWLVTDGARVLGVFPNDAAAWRFVEHFTGRSTRRRKHNDPTSTSEGEEP
jgi:hypothetical protein